MANTNSRAWHVAILLALVAVLAVLSVLLVEVKKTPAACPAGVGTGAPAAAATHAGVGVGDGASAAAVSNACTCSTDCVCVAGQAGRPPVQVSNFRPLTVSATTVESLKKMIAFQYGILPNLQRLSFNGVTGTLTDVRTLGYYGIVDGSTVELQLVF